MTSLYLPHCWVVIVNWRKAHDTIGCIQSILRGGFPPSQVLVVDNGSQDESDDQIRSKFPEVELHSLPKNLGFSGGYNYGIEMALAAGAEQIFLLNNDTIINQDTIPALLACDADVAVPKIYYHRDAKRIWSAGAQWRRFPPMVVIRGYQKLDKPHFDKPVALQYATACALMIRREVFERVGRFDPEFENYHEDYDFCYRVRTAGFNIRYVPKAQVWHKVSQSLGLSSPRFWWYLGRNCVLFYRKEDRFPAWMLTSFLVWVTLRETLKLNFRHLPDFWSGVNAGIVWVKHGTSRM
jgi:GT2 family glycosyltransferase